MPHNFTDIPLNERTMQLSLVIPLCNEEESLEQLHREICEVADENKYDIEIIFVDDGSTDKSWSIVEKLAASDSRIRGIQFRRNFGKAAALQAGFNAAKGEFVITMDADLQDDPKEIPDFLRQMEETGVDVISGWKKRRYDPWHKLLSTRIFNGLVSFMSGVKLHDHNCGMKCYRREVVKSVALYGSWHRFVPVLAAAQGFKVGEKVVAHRARQFGQSKYGFMNRFLKGLLDPITIWFLTKYGQRPMHFFGGMGMAMIALGIACFFVEVAMFGLFSAYMFASMIPTGIVFIALGFVAELFVSRTIQPERCYSVKKETEPQS
ncbi:MAG: glycosyltransferase family 2 protein [Planctomycetaceae bacterium]|nr:glycosyltransferase family 2 protein [Planctomycetaceae bacterium]